MLSDHLQNRNFHCMITIQKPLTFSNEKIRFRFSLLRVFIVYYNCFLIDVFFDVVFKSTICFWQSHLVFESS